MLIGIDWGGTKIEGVAMTQEGVELLRLRLGKGASSTWLLGQPVEKDLKDTLKCYIRVENEADCLATSEAVDGAGAGLVWERYVDRVARGLSVVVNTRLISSQSNLKARKMW